MTSPPRLYEELSSKLASAEIEVTCRMSQESSFCWGINFYLYSVYVILQLYLNMPWEKENRKKPGWTCWSMNITRNFQPPKDLEFQILTAGGESRHDDGSHGFWQPREREGNGAENLKHLSGKLLCIYREIRYEDRMGDSVKDRMIYPHIYPRYEDSMGDSGTLKSDLFHTGQVFREPSLKNFSATRAVLRWKLSPNLTKTYWHILTLNWSLNETALPNELQNSISLLL